MATFTSSLPDYLFEALSKESKNLNTPKNKILEKALTLYLRELKKARYAKSYQRASDSEEIMNLAEEGMADYFQMILDSEKE